MRAGYQNVGPRGSNAIINCEPVAEAKMHLSERNRAAPVCCRDSRLHFCVSVGIGACSDSGIRNSVASRIFTAIGETLVANLRANRKSSGIAL
jgi:hypothetical protein